MKERLFRLGLGLSALSLLCWVITSYTKLAVCASDSLKGIHYALFLKSTSIKRGDIVLLPNYPVPYVGEKPLAKRVLGFPGDKVTHNKGQLKIESKNAASQMNFPTTLPLLDKTKEGKLLTPLSISIVPEGYIFVAGDNARSFDSRYEEFGLIEKKRIWGKAIWVCGTHCPAFKWILESVNQEARIEK